MDSKFFHLESLKREERGENYLEFFKNPALSSGIYSLKAGEMDGQSPHPQDEIYYVISGTADFETLGPSPRKEEVTQGSILFVPKNLEHRFSNIREDLTLFVVFAGN